MDHASTGEDEQGLKTTQRLRCGHGWGTHFLFSRLPPGFTAFGLSSSLGLAATFEAFGTACAKDMVKWSCGIA